MTHVIQWIEAHPVVFALLIWPTVTAIVTSVFSKPSDAFASKYPRLAALRRIPSDAGINLPKLLGNVLVMLTGKVAAAPAEFPDEGPTKKEGRSLPPPLPVIFMLLALCSCAAAAESSYTAQQLQCVDRAKTLEESKACRAEVDRQWHVDGGAK